MKLKYWFLIVSVIIISVVGFISYGFYIMAIEDHYGDLQEVFYKAKSGDIILNHPTQELGVTSKSFMRIRVVDAENNSKDLFNWAYLNGKPKRMEVYRPKDRIYNEELKYSDVLKSIENLKWKLIIRN